MPIAAIGLGLGTALAGGAAAGATIYGAHKQSSAAQRAADAQVQAANYAAQQQSQSQADALAFQRQQAEATFHQQENDRRANYEQWLAGQRMNYDLMAAREQRLGSVGAALGFGGRGQMPAFNAPAYVPGVDPHLDPNTPSAAGSSAPPQGAMPPQDDPRLRAARPRAPLSVGALLGGR